MLATCLKFGASAKSRTTASFEGLGGGAVASAWWLAASHRAPPLEGCSRLKRHELEMATFGADSGENYGEKDSN